MQLKHTLKLFYMYVLNKVKLKSIKLFYMYVLNIKLYLLFIIFILK